MNNFQLYKTNVYLGGQIKWDLTLESARDEMGYGVLFVNDFKLTPISKHIPFNAKSNHNILNYSHLENIKTYYNLLENQFYKSVPNSDFDFPTVWDDSLNVDGKLDRSQKRLWKDLHDSTIEMGLSRSSCSKTGKQFEFFCPVWLENFDPSKDVLSFKFALRAITNKDTTSNNQEIITKSLVLRPSGLWNTHTKFVNYFNDYATAVKLTSKASGGMGEDLLHINIEKSSATISGIDVKYGTNVQFKKIDNLVEDLCSTERLLMDFDNILTKNFRHNLIVSRQLINFNFIFDADEFITPNILNMMYGAGFEMDVHVEINGQELPMRDFYTNYEFIPRKPIGYLAKNNENYQNQNIFDLIKDHKNISLINKNKNSQNIFHWALANNPEYIFNLYTGFGGYFIDEKSSQLGISPYNYQDSPDIWTDIYTESLGNIDWCYSKTMNNVPEYINFLHHLNEYSDKTIIGDHWCSNIYFRNEIKFKFPLVILINEDPSNFINGLYSLSPTSVVIKMPDSYRKILSKNTKTQYSNSLEGLGVVEFGGPGGLKCIVCDKNKINSITFSTFKKSLDSFIKDFQMAKEQDPEHNYDINRYVDDATSYFENGLGWLSNEEFISWLSSIKEPSIINMNLLGYIPANGPVKEIEELEHIKVKESKSKIFRYDGDLKPCFIKKDSLFKNYLYFKKGMFQSDLSSSPFTKYINSGYPATYPSINYYPYDKYLIDIVNDRDIRLLDADSRQPININDFLPYEYKLFNTSKVLLLHKYLEIDIILDPKLSDIHDEITNRLQSIYDIDKDKALYIYDLYNISLDWDYAYNDNTNIYNYKIKLTLK